MSSQIAVIADIVGSRHLADRVAAQEMIEASVCRAEVAVPGARLSLTATVGDELEAVFDDVPTTLAWILIFRLSLDPTVDLRFGIGVGSMQTIPAVGRELADGPAWWAAREAVNHARRLQHRGAPFARTWIASAEAESTGRSAEIALANAGLLAQDQILSTMGERARRLAYGRMRGKSQRELASDESVSQSAVSQSLASSGALALIEGFAALRAGVRS